MLRFARQRLRGSGPALAFVLLTGALTSFLGVVSPAFSRVFLDRILTGENPDWLYPGVALRGWLKVPWAYYRWGERGAHGLTEAEKSPATD